MSHERILHMRQVSETCSLQLAYADLQSHCYHKNLIKATHVLKSREISNFIKIVECFEAIVFLRGTTWLH